MVFFLIPPPTVLKKNLQKILSSSFSSKCRLRLVNMWTLQWYENFYCECTVLPFQATTNLLQHRRFKITTKQLQVLLTYAEADINDYSRHATGFDLIKAILKRKLMCQEMHEVMGRIEKMAITAEMSSIREKCRTVCVSSYTIVQGSQLQCETYIYVKEVWCKTCKYLKYVT